VQLLAERRDRVLDERLGVGAVEYLEPRALERREIGRPRGVERSAAQEARQGEPAVAQRERARRMGAQVLHDDLAEAILAECDAQLRIVLRESVVQPARVHPRVDPDVAGGDQVAFRGVADAAVVEQPLQLCQVSHRAAVG